MTTLITIEQARAEAHSRVADALQMVEIARDFTVTNDAEAEVAAEQLRGIAKFVKGQNERRLELTRPYDATKAEIIAAFNEPTATASEAEGLLRKALTEYQLEQRRIADERRRQEEVRIERERRAAEEEAQRQRDRAAALKTDEARERALDKADAAQEKADELSVTSAAVAAPTKLTGFSVRDNWTFEVERDGLESIVKAIASGRADLLMYLQFDLVQVGKTVKSSKGAIPIPGIRAVNKPVSAVR